jgi:hypothetical protein
MVKSNLALSEKYGAPFKDLIEYWIDPEDLVKAKDCDVFWDEMATYVDANEYKNLPLELKRWIQQHRKIGVEIWGTTQDFAQIDKSFRRLTDTIYYNVKLIGSRDISPTRPPPKYIWGIIIQRSINPTDYNEDDKGSQAKGFNPMLITRKKTEVFDTRQEILPGKPPPLRHVERKCLTCGKVYATHS